MSIDVPSPRDHSNTTDRPLACRVELEIVAGPHQGESFEADHYQTLVVGRETTAQLCLSNDPYFSRHHFCLEINPPTCIFRDLESRNGTYVNGQRCTEKPLSNGDVISGGKTKLRVNIHHLDTDTGKINAKHPKATSPSLSSTVACDVTEDFSFPDIPGYEVHEEIGQGGMGVVHRATQKSTGKEVAIKIIRAEDGITESDMQFFVREANVLSQLDHARIVKFHEFGYAQNQIFLVMDCVNTVDLEKVLKKQSPASRIRIISGIASQVLEALDYAHSQSLVHRDVKPSNVLVHRPQKKLKVKLADFGLAKNYLNAGFSGMTLEGDIRGTLKYIPPELIADSRYAKPHCDIYSLGVTMYEWLSGELPFDFAKPHEQVLAVLESTPPPLAELCPEAPTELIQIVEKSMSKDPLNRYSSAKQMQNSLLPFRKRQ